MSAPPERMPPALTDWARAALWLEVERDLEALPARLAPLLADIRDPTTWREIYRAEVNKLFDRHLLAAHHMTGGNA